MAKRFIEDDFDLNEFQKNFISERTKIIKKKNNLLKEKIIFKIISFIIMATSLMFGSLLYLLLSRLIEKVYL